MDMTQYRKVLSEAIDAEIAAQKFYTEVAGKIKKPYLQELFEKFAAEEKKHETILTDILNQGKTDQSFFHFDMDFKVSETIEMPEVSPDMDLKSAIGLAMKNEEIAMKKYTALAQNCADERLKAVFMDLAAMERDHKFKMEQNFVDVAYPEVW